MGFPTGFISNTISALLEPYAEFAFLMGSAETERFHSESDIDIAVFWKSSTTDAQVSELTLKLIGQLGRDIDMVALNKIDPIFARQVLEKGRLLFAHSKGLLLKWKMEKLSDYPDFKVSRQIIEENILNRKKYV